MIDISFLVICYNQNKYIECVLESIKYQVLNHLQDYSVQLVIADDASRDGTFITATNWIHRNHEMFIKVDTIQNSFNQGVRANLLNGIKKVDGKYLKIVAGDDILPVESIRPFFEQLDKDDLVMGLPLYFNKSNISRDYRNISIIHRIREDIDGKRSLLERIENDCFIHSPSVYLRTVLIRDDRVILFMKQFDFLDDYPLWYAIALYNPEIKYCFLERVAILYRRTEKSAVFIREKSIMRDRKKLAMIIGSRKGIRLYTRFTKWNEAIVTSFGNNHALKYLMVDNYVKKICNLVVKYAKYRHPENYDLWVRENNIYLDRIVTSVAHRYE